MSFATLHELIKAEGWTLDCDTTQTCHQEFSSTARILMRTPVSAIGKGLSKADARVAAAGNLLHQLGCNATGSRTPVEDLHQYAQNLGLMLDYSDQNHPPRFEVSIRIAGRLVAHETGSSRDIAKEAAAAIALTTLQIPAPNNWGDQVSQMVLNKWVEQTSLQQRFVFSRSIIAGFVQTTGTSTKVVCVGTGTAHSPEVDPPRPSKALLDCHAEVHPALQPASHPPASLCLLSLSLSS